MLMQLNTQFIARQMKHYESIESTNITAKQWAKDGAVEGSLVVADTQTLGKGRLGRAWDSPVGVGLWLSIVLRPNFRVDKVAQLTLIAGVAMSEAIEAVTGLDTKIKWPNDIIINKKKVCGILCEMQVKENKIQYVIAGIGVNVNNLDFPENLPHATSLYIEGGQAYDKKDIRVDFCNRFEDYYKKYQETFDLEFLLEEYKNRCINLNNKANIIDNQTSYEADIQDITAEGHLVVQTADGCIKHISSGEVSVRGLYGYV